MRQKIVKNLQDLVDLFREVKNQGFPKNGWYFEVSRLDQMPSFKQKAKVGAMIHAAALQQGLNDERSLKMFRHKILSKCTTLATRTARMKNGQERKVKQDMAELSMEQMSMLIDEVDNILRTEV